MHSTARTPLRGGQSKTTNLLHNQLQVWIAQALLPDQPIYNLAVALKISGEIDLRAFQEAFQTLLNSSDALRTVFEDKHGIPIQRVRPLFSCPLRILDFSRRPVPPETAKNWMRQRSKLPFDLRKGLFDSALIKLAPNKFTWYLNVHHIISDAWSVQLVYRFMAQFYELALTKRLGEQFPLYSFQEYVAYERQIINSARRRKAEAYWKQKLSVESEPLRFHGKTAIKKRTRVTRRSHDLGYNRSQKLRQAVRQMGCPNQSEDALLLEMFYSVLCAYVARLHDNGGCFIGIVSHNRRRRPLKHTIGLFSEVLPARISIDEGDTFSSLMRKVNAEILETVRHGNFVVANPVNAPVYDIVLNYHKVSFSNFVGLPAFPDWIHTGHGAESLAIQIHDFGASGNLVVDFDFHDDVFSEYQREQTGSHFLRLIDAFLAEPYKPIHQIDLLASDEGVKVLVDWNDTDRSLPTEKSVCALFEKQVRSVPHAIAVIQEDKTLTYAELDSRANQLAWSLKRRGVASGTLVGIYIERSLEMVVGILGILKAGGAYVPISPACSSERLAFILRDTQLPLLLTQRPLLENLPKLRPEVLCLDSDWEKIGQESKKESSNPLSGDQLAYMIYTSGSTGEPKGVEITHRALLNFVAWANVEYGLGTSDRVLQFAAIEFDTAVEEIFPCLTQGATLVLRTEKMIASVSTFFEKCREWRVTVLDLPTSYWHQLVRNVSPAKHYLPETLRLLIIGGETASTEVFLCWQKWAGNHCRIMNTYGPTEATVVATACDLTELSSQHAALETVPIGRPISNVRTYVLDQYLSPVPVGTAGELYIGGIGLARGYHNSPSVTSEKFVVRDLVNGVQERLYRTGDIVRYRADGYLEFLGRRDGQLKIMGYRVEPQEVENVLVQYPGVNEAAVTAFGADTECKRLAAYVVPERETEPSVSEIMAYLSRKLPSYMMPVSITFTACLPRTLAGKIDRKALPALDPKPPGPSGISIVTYTAVEKTLADIWCEILSLKSLNLHESFFSLGGHSLAATQVVSRIRDVFKIDLPLRAIFETPTIAGLANQIQLALQNSRAGTDRPPLVPVGRHQDLPLSFAQTRMWFLHRLAPVSAAYNLGVALRLNGKLNMPALERSFNEIIRRHEAIRTVFPAVDGQPRQVITDAQSVPITVIDLRNLPPDQRVGDARRIVTETARQPFDLEQDLLMRVLLIQLAEDEHVLLVTMHHIASDQWSMGIIARELTHLYSVFCHGRQPELSPTKVEYADFAVWQRQWLESNALRQQLCYWKKQLTALPPLKLPICKERPPAQTFNGAHITGNVSSSLVEALKRVSVREGVTLYMTFLAAFKALLFRYSGQTDIAVGSPIANRNWLALEGIVGSFVNTLVLRTDLSGNPTFCEVLRRVRDVTIDAYAHQEVPFEKVVEELRPERDARLSPLVQVLFNFQNAPLGEINFHGLSWSVFEFDLRASQFDLCLAVDADVLSKIALIYNPDVFDESQITRMLRHYVRILEAVVANPREELGLLKMLSNAEEQELLETWNNVDPDVPNNLCTHSLIAAQAEQKPESVAVIFENHRVTYKQLNTYANQLAHYLRSAGVKPEIPVGICMERSIDMVIGLLAVLKAGGAYVPLDPNHPWERISMILEDSKVPLVLTQEKWLRKLPQNDLRFVCVDRDCTLISCESPDNPSASTRASHLAYILYTSGSTGQPKGAEITHGALVNFLLSMAKEPGLTSNDVVFSVTPLSFDIAALEIFLPLTVGARVALLPWEVSLDGRLLRDRMDAGDATVLQATPMTWRLLLEAGWNGNPGLKILCGGEALSMDLAEQLLGRGSSVWNLYGPTETTVWSLVQRLKPNSERITIGQPIANTCVRILDDNLQLVPIGVEGELYIAGSGLARGYLNSGDLTAGKFIPDPFSNEPGSRLYRTGDLVRSLPEGNIEFLGRIDHQVKLRGVRVELGEIEAVLRRHAAIDQVVVTVREDSANNKRLVAYIVSKQKAFPPAAELRSFLKLSLPESMVPSAFVFLDTLPLTPNRKVDHRALPAPDQSRPELKETYEAPRTPTEELLAGIWAKILNVDKVGIRDNFFELGGHSLLAMQVLSRAREALHTQLPVRTLFERPTIAGLAEQIGQSETKASAQEEVTNVLAELESLSEEEARCLVSEQRGKDCSH